jgi:CHAT domain-containing protein
MTNFSGPISGLCPKIDSRTKRPVLILMILSLLAGKMGYPGSLLGNAETRQSMLRRFQECTESGERRLREGYYRESIQLFSEARDLARKLEDPEKEVLCLIQLGRTSWAAGQLEESRTFYSEALDDARKHALEGEAAQCEAALKIAKLYAEGRANRQARQPQKALGNFRTAIDLAVRSRSREHELKCLRQLGMAQAEAGDRAGSVAANESALRIARELHDRREQVKCLINAGVFSLGAKEYTKALNHFSDALELSREIGASQDESNCLRNIGLIMMDLGFIERALEHLQAAQEIDRRSGSVFFLSQNMNSLGVALRNKALALGAKEDLYKAYDCLSGALDLARETGDEQTELIALNTLGNVCLDLRKYSAALHYFQSSLAVSGGNPDPLSVMEILTNTGICQLELGHYEKAIGLFNEVLAMGKRCERAKILWEPLFHLGRCYEKTGAPQQALASYRSSVEAIEHIRSQVVVEDFRVGFGRGKLKVYESLIALLSSLSAAGALPNGEEEVFRTAEKIKERDLSARIAATIGELSGRDLTRDKKKKLQETLRVEEDEYLRLISRMRAETPEAADIILPLPVRLEQVQDFLPDEKTAVLEYFLAEKKSYLFVITKKSASSVDLVSQDKIEASLEAYVNLFSHFPRGGWEGGFAAAQLAREVLFPALRLLPASIEHLIIIPDGSLCYVPFEAFPPLPPDRPSQGDFLISRYSISYAPSCSVLLSLWQRNQAPAYRKDFLAFGNPDYSRNLTNQETKPAEVAGLMKDIYEGSGFDLSPLGQSEKEIRKISRRFSEKRSDIYLQKEAREEILKKAPLEDYQVIHFACHAFLDDRVPFRSGLFLSFRKSDVEDGFVQSREIASLRLDAALVVLSACQTSRGYLEKGEGIMGLTRVFFYSGARSVISTLWEIEDRAAADFMGYFYDFLSHGETLSQALRAAKLRMLESKKSHPFYWAAFVLNGEPFSRIHFH